MKDILELINKFKEIRVLIVGDVMLDRFQWGSVNRISPEAPVPIVALEKSSVVAGGAANVAANVAGLGATPTLLGITGADADAKLFPEILKKSGVENFKLFELKNRQTTVKTRVIAHQQQVVRIDQESVKPLTREESADILQEIEEYLKLNDIIILSDYSKGFLTKELLTGLIMKADRLDKPIIVDPKGKDFKKYKGATIITPNHKEFIEACNLERVDEEMVETSGRKLLADLALKALLITQGENGIKLLETNQETIHLKATARKVFDVTGAGDTVIASLAVAIAAKLNLKESTEFANLTAGIVVEHLGTTSINKELLQNSLK